MSYLKIHPITMFNPIRTYRYALLLWCSFLLSLSGIQAQTVPQYRSH